MLKKAVLSHALVLGTLSVMNLVTSLNAGAAYPTSKQVDRGKAAKADPMKDGGGKGAGNGTPTLTQPITVKYNGSCTSGRCQGPDSLAPYRKIFGDGRPLDISDLPKSKATYYFNLNEPAAGFEPFYQFVNRATGSLIYFDTTDLVPKAAAGSAYAADTEKCIASHNFNGCVIGGSDPWRDYMTYFNSLFYPAPLISEEGELRTYPVQTLSELGPGVPEKELRLRRTFHVSGNYIIVKLETCDNDVNWIENGYVFADQTRDLMTGTVHD